jgi:hypothetical protein
MTTALSPTVTYHGWWPATVLLPRTADPQTIWHTCRVYATDAGLVVFRARPASPGAAEIPDWSSPIDYSRTMRPINGLPGYAHDVHTEDGLVVVTQTGGCGCGNRLARWRPEFSHRVASWPVAT